MELNGSDSPAFTKEEELMRLLHRAVAMTRRHPPHGECSPEPPEDFAKPHDACGAPPSPPVREPGRMHLLLILSCEENIGQRELAERSHLRPQSVSEILAKLENEGLIVRTRGSDKREMLVSLSEEITTFGKSSLMRLSGESTLRFVRSSKLPAICTYMRASPFTAMNVISSCPYLPL